MLLKTRQRHRQCISASMCPQLRSASLRTKMLNYQHSAFLAAGAQAGWKMRRCVIRSPSVISATISMLLQLTGVPIAEPHRLQEVYLLELQVWYLQIASTRLWVISICLRNRHIFQLKKTYLDLIFFFYLKGILMLKRNCPRVSMCAQCSVTGDWSDSGVDCERGFPVYCCDQMLRGRAGTSCILSSPQSRVTVLSSLYTIIQSNYRSSVYCTLYFA